MLNALAIFLVFIGTIIAAFASLYLKKGAKHFNFNIIRQLNNKDLVFGVILFIIVSLLYLYALGMERLSILYPFTSLTYVWVALVSIKFLKEKMNKYKWISIFLIILGIFLITYFSA
ncbi:EamA family transporter [Candidatus Woesearchaeota archaeon]|nr:EamA family transporter [Candidatus Woesearchaeota archaeon]